MRDPGVQPERTALAWHRTALAMLVNGALLVRAAAEARSSMVWAVAVLVVVAALGLFAVGWLRSRAILLSATSSSSPHAVTITALVAAVWLACAAVIFSGFLKMFA